MLALIRNQCVYEQIVLISQEQKDESDSEDEESEDEEEKPELEAASINHNGCVNRIRVEFS